MQCRAIARQRRQALLCWHSSYPPKRQSLETIPTGLTVVYRHYRYCLLCVSAALFYGNRSVKSSRAGDYHGERVQTRQHTAF
jgi:hypothetical protein